MCRFNKITFTSMALSLLFTSGSVLAQSPEASQNTQEIEELVVTGQFLSVDQVNSVKTPTPIIDVPQSLSIFTSDQILAQGIDSIGDIIDYTAGVNTSQGEGHRDSVVFRGVRSTADFYLDGNRDDVQYYRGLYNIEQVEILRGPNALLFGRGGTGGILNRVTKKAEFDEGFTTVLGTLNSFGGTGLQLDTNIVASDSRAYRLNVMYETLENHRDFFDGERFGFNPTARLLLTPSTTLDLSYEYVDHERFVDRGIPTGADGRPVAAFEDIVFADPEANLTGLKAHILRAALQHEFSDQMKGNLSLHYGDYDKFYENFYASGFDPASNVVELDGYYDETQRSNLIAAANLVSEFKTNRLGHTVIIGSEYISTDSDQFRFNPVFNTSLEDTETFLVSRPLALNNGSGVNSAGQPTSYTFSDLNDDTRVDLEVFSLYLQDQIEISEHLDVLLGARFDRFDITVFNAKAAETRERKDQEISPRLGVIYKPVENVSIYASYSESFLPRSGEQFADINGDNNQLDPDTFANTEIGLKWDLENGLSLTAALFENEQSSPQVADSDPSTLDVIDSQIDGFELQLTGPVTNHWFVQASYTQLDGEQVNRFGATGLTPRELPESMFSIWNRFDISEKLGLGLGLTYQDETFIDSGNTAVLPSYTRVDASAFYQLSDNLRLQLHVENITDELYFPNAHSTHQASIGAPLNAQITLTGRY